jgi:hypothetical protein
MAYTNIDDPSAHFQTGLYTGTGNEIVFTNDGNSDLQPDFIWIKNRDDFTNHHAHNTNVATTRTLFVNKSDYEETQSQSVKSIQSDGFTLGTWGGDNINNQRFVAWQWKANGGTTSSNTDGSITSTVQANQDAGFSIVTYTGTGVYNQTVGHGLGATPAVVIVKNRTSADTSYDDWWVFHHKTSNPINRVLALNENAAEVSSTVFWSVLPSSTIFGVGGSTNAPRYTNGASQDYIAYCFAEKQGYSKFGSYVGNGNVNGPFVYTGFKPAWFMIKATSASGGDGWQMVDAKRNPFNNHSGVYNKLGASSTSYESASDHIGGDFLSNGLKVRATDSGWNTNGRTYTYMAFAENPFVTSTGVPTTAR